MAQYLQYLQENALVGQKAWGFSISFLILISLDLLNIFFSFGLHVLFSLDSVESVAIILSAKAFLIRKK